MKYLLQMHSEEYGCEDFYYDSLEETMAGFERLSQKIQILDDGIERWFCITGEQEQ